MKRAGTRENFFVAVSAGLGGLVFGAALLLCVTLSTSVAAENNAPQVQEEESQTSLLQNPAWQRVEALYKQLPFAWARRFEEFKAMADDLDTYSRNIAPKLVQLRTATADTQMGAVNLMLDLVPTQTSVAEAYYIVQLLLQWRWKLDTPLQETASVLAALDHFSTLLEGTHRAIQDLLLQGRRRPVMERTAPDFIVLHELLYERTSKLRDDIRKVRVPALSLFIYIESNIDAAEEKFPQQWIAYYLKPLTITTGALSHLSANVTAMWHFLRYDYYPDSWFPMIFNVLLLALLGGLHIFFCQLLSAPQEHAGHLGFVRAVGTAFYSLDRWRQWGLALAVVITANSLLHNLPQFHEFVPFLFVWQTVLALVLALWARTRPGAPKVWEQVLPIFMGFLLLYGDAAPILVLFGMGSTQAVVLFSLLRRNDKACTLRSWWTGILLLGLLLTMLGLGRLCIILYMLLVLVPGSFAIVQQWAGHSALTSHPLERKIFLLALMLGLGITGLNFLIICPGLGFLLGYWQENALRIGNISLNAGNALLILLLLLGVYMLSQVGKQSLLNLAKRRRVLDTSAVPMLNTMLNVTLWTISGVFLLGFMGLDVTSLAFIGGGLTVGVGIASKTILSNFFCGLVIIFARVVRAGDLVEINGVRGRVMTVNMRSTMVETLTNGILLIPNEEMLNSRLTNWTLNNKHAREDMPVSVMAKSDVQAVLAALEEAARRLPSVLTTPPPKALLSGFGDGSMDFILQVWVEDVIGRNSILSALRQHVHEVFEQRGIELSLPCMEVSVSSSSGEKG